MLVVEFYITSVSAHHSVTSPFHLELSRLRQQRLQIEQEHLLEVKRQNELERIRGPANKW